MRLRLLCLRCAVYTYHPPPPLPTVLPIIRPLSRSSDTPFPFSIRAGQRHHQKAVPDTRKFLVLRFFCHESFIYLPCGPVHIATFVALFQVMTVASRSLQAEKGYMVFQGCAAAARMADPSKLIPDTSDNGRMANKVIKLTGVVPHQEEQSQTCGRVGQRSITARAPNAAETGNMSAIRYGFNVL
jgi:hypothetical protein